MISGLGLSNDVMDETIETEAQAQSQAEREVIEEDIEMTDIKLINPDDLLSDQSLIDLNWPGHFLIAKCLL